MSRPKARTLHHRTFMRTPMFVPLVLVASSLAIFCACGESSPPSPHPASEKNEGAKDDGEPIEPKTTTAAGATCGNGKCEATESCDLCAQDCGVCTVCPLARSCTNGGTDSPPALVPVPSLNVGFEELTKGRIALELARRAQNGDPALLVVEQVLAASNEDANLRAVLELYPEQARAIRRALSRPEIAGPLALARSRHLEGAMAKNETASDGPFGLRPATTKVGEMLGSPLGSIAEAMSNEPGADAGGGSAADAGGKPVKCDAPRLRLRVASITAKELDDDIAGDIIFCSVAARSSAVQSPIRMIPKTPNLNSKQTHTYAPSEGTFWGVDGPVDPGGDLEIRYDCFEEDTVGGYEKFIAALAGAIKKAGGTFLPSGYGYVVSTAADIIRDVLPTVLALDADDHLFSATQTIPRASQMQLLSGAKWSVRKKGTHLWSDWDWRLDIESYGCMDNGIAQ